MQPFSTLLCPHCSSHVGKLVINSLGKEDLALARELHLQPLLSKRDDLLARYPVQIRVLETRLYSLDDLTITRSVHHGLEVGSAARA